MISSDERIQRIAMMNLEGDGESKMRLKPPTLSDVAKIAGVSVGTVSKALNGRGRLREETRDQVKQAANKLMFRPNPLAQGLHAGKTGTVGLITTVLDGRFSMAILTGVEDALGTGNLSVFLCDARGDSIREQYHLRALLERRVDGLIVVADNASARPSLGQDLRVPIIYAYGASDDDQDISVVSDNVQGGRVGAEHLVQVGRRRIAYIGGDPEYSATQDRLNGAAEAIRAAGLDLAAPPLFGPWTENWGRQATRIMLERAPQLDAIMCGNDQIARGVLDALRDAGRTVPDDVAVLGHDNWEVFAAHSRPPLSTIDMNLELLGRRAAQLLFAAIDGHEQPGVFRVNCRVVSRDSTL